MHTSITRAAFVAAIISLVAATFVAPAAVASESAAPSGAVSGEIETDVLADVDVRTDLDAESRPRVLQRLALARFGDAQVRWDAGAGAPGLVTRQQGTLSEASDAAPSDAALAYLADNAGLYRLTAGDLAQVAVADVSRTESLGVTHVLLRRTDAGRRVFGSEFTVHVDDEGEVVAAGGDLRAGATALAVPTVTSQQAIAAASNMTDEATTIQGTPELVTFPMGAGEPARPAWLMTVDQGHVANYETVIDARTTAVLFRQNRVHSSGPEGNVYTVQNPTLGSQQIVSFAGWVDDRTTLGNNARAGHDLDGNSTIDYSPQTPANGDPAYQHFNYTYTDAINSSGGTDFTTDRDAVITQAFYYVNMLHDRYLAMGFDEANRNFQNTNFSGQGAGGDRVNVYVDYGATAGICCNATMETPGDGGSPWLRLRVGLAPDNRDMHRSMNGDTVTHEYGHGVSNRLVGGGNMGSGAQTDGLGEGWSDVLAFSLWNDPVYGEYNNNNATTGIRSVAYDTSTLTYDDVCQPGCQEHADGEVWATAMWDVRTVFTTKYGQANGALRFEQNLLDGMKLAPTDTDFLEARDAFIQANETRYSGTEVCSIWQAFTLTGLGFSATSSANQMTVTEATDVAPGCRPTADAGGPYNGSEGTDVPLSGLGSAMATHPSAGGNSFQWDLDNDGMFDDAGGPSPAFTSVGQEGAYPIGLRVVTQAGASDTDSSTVTIANVLPSIGGSVSSPRPEGSMVTTTGVLSDPGWLDPLSGTVDWSDGPPEALTGPMENLRPNATLTFTNSHAYGDNGSYTVTRCGRDDHPTLVCTADVATVTNVPPAVSIAVGQVTAIPEGGMLDVSATFLDPGWLDTYSASIDWGTGESSAVVPVVTVQGPPADTGTVGGSHVYGDNGTYTVTISVTDDDMGVGSASFDVVVGNIDPTATIDVSGATIINGVPTIISQFGQPVPFAAGSVDPGSDDIRATWDWDDGSPLEERDHLVNPPFADPFPSPSVHPRDVTDSTEHTFGEACLYSVGFSATDDDLGSASDGAAVLITGNADKGKPSGWWHSEYKYDGTKSKLGAPTLECYLAIANFGSSVFDEVVPLTTFADAHAILHPERDDDPKYVVQLDRQLLANWLNFANGVYGWDTPVYDTDKDKVLDLTFGQFIVQSEAARLDPATTDQMLKDLKKVAEKVNSFKQ